MSHVEPTTPPETAPPPTPDAPPPAPERTPDPTPPAPAADAGGDRLGNLETIVSNLADSVGKLLDISDDNDPEDKPVKLPWTHWGTKPRGNR